ncbi:unnamed protein product [Chrysoparadoxa australica]
MANQAAKKAAKAMSRAQNTYLPLVLGLNLLYVIYRVVWQFNTFSSWNWTGLALTSLCYWYGYTGVVEGAGLGGGAGSYCFDLLVMTMVVQGLGLFSDKAFYIYLIVPGYLLYYVLKKVASWMRSASEPDPEPTAEEKRRAEKKEKKAQRKQQRPGLMVRR